MVRELTEQQQELATDVWELATLRAALSQQLAEVEAYQREAITFAALYGVKQPLLAAACGLTRSRISQIVATTTIRDTDLTTRRQAWQETAQWPARHLARLRQAATEHGQDRRDDIFKLIHGRHP